MTTLHRGTYNICTMAGTAKATLVAGYLFEVEVHHGFKWAYVTYKDEAGRWHLMDFLTGLPIETTAFSTRRECIDKAESDEAKQKMFEYYTENTDLYLAKSDVFKRLEAGESMDTSTYYVMVSELAAMRREAREAEQVAEVATEAVVVTLASMKEKAWPDVLVQQTRDGSCIWVTGNVAEHAEELKELGFRKGRSKKYGRGWWLKPVEA